MLTYPHTSRATRTTRERPVYGVDKLFIQIEREAIITTRGIEGAPDLVVEVVSPFSTRHDRTTKAVLYARFALPHY